MLKDDRGLNVGDFRLRCECAHGDVAQVIRVPHHYMDQEIVGSGHVIEGDNFR